MSPKLPMSTRLPSIFMPACSLPAATIAGVMGSEGLMEATSNAGVWPSIDPAANTTATMMEGSERLDTAVYLAVRNIVRYRGLGWQSEGQGHGSWGIVPSPDGRFGADR